MAFSRIVIPGDGVTSQFNIPFALGYIRQSDITCRVGDETDGLGAPLYRALTFISEEVVQVQGAVPGLGVNVVFERTVPSSSMLVDYENGDVMNEENLNKAQKQALMLVHQVLDGRFSTFLNDLDMGGFQIHNLGSGDEPTDAANRGDVTTMATQIAITEATRIVNGVVIGQGNVPIATTNEVGKRLMATAAGNFGWYGQKKDQVNVLHILGQSNAQGARNGGPNPASPLVKCWNKVTNTWGSSDYTQSPWTQANPNGNSGNNNVGLAFAHRWAEETGRPTYVIFYFVGGTSIDHWVADGNAGGNGDYMAAWKAAATAAYASPELSGKVTLNAANHAIIWAQGEEDFTMDFTTYLTKFTTVNNDIRTFIGIPHLRIFVDGMSTLHDRYAPDKALQHYCGYVNADTRFVNSKGLKTEFDSTGAGDFTHWIGPELWEFGYNRVWAAWDSDIPNGKVTPNLFWARGTGQATHDSGQVIFAGHSLVSWNSRDRSSSAVNSLSAATDSIAWGEQCSADGNWTYTFGHTNVTDNLSNYTLLAGRELTSGPNGDYGIAGGFQNGLNHAYSVVFGRNNLSLADSSFTAGAFGEFISVGGDAITFQFGVGTSTGKRKTAIAARQSGAVRIGTPTATANLPAAASAGQWFQTIDSTAGMRVQSDGTKWRSMNGYTWGTPVGMAGQTVVDFNSIPTSAEEIVIYIDGTSATSTQTFGLQIGDAGGIDAGGYRQGSASDIGNWTIFGGTAANFWTILITLRKGPGDLVLMQATSTTASFVDKSAAAGHKTLADMTRVRMMLSAAGNYDAGTMYVGWR